MPNSCFDWLLATSLLLFLVARSISVKSPGNNNSSNDYRIVTDLYEESLIRLRRNSRRDDCRNTGLNGQRFYPLSLGVLLPESYRRRIEPSIDLALEHVHASQNLLVDYCLRLIYKDTQCKTSLGMKSLFDLMNAGGPEPNSQTILLSGHARASSANVGQTDTETQSAEEIQSVLNEIDGEDGTSIRPAALFGDVCTDVNEPVAMASKYWDLLHLSYAETHSKFSTADSKDLYPTFFRIVPGDRNLIRARSHLVKFFNWTRVGTIKQSDEPFYSLPHERLTTVLENSHHVRVIYTAGLSNDQINNIANELEELKRRDAHIIIGDFSAQLALHVLCEAFHLHMHGADYLWILPGYHREDWWRAAPLPQPGGHNRQIKTCSAQQIQTVLQGHFATEFAPLRSYSTLPLIANKTVTQVQQELRDFCRRKQSYCPEDVHSAYAYDGIWTLALALNATLYRNGSTQRLGGPILASRLLPYVQSTSFEGLTGRVRFENNERLGLVNILQWMNGSYSKVGFYDSAENSFFLQPLGGWTSPLDATVVRRERQYVSYYLLGVMCLLSFIGIFLALIFFVVNVKFRNHRFIKMSSPNMNNLIIIGSMFAYAAVFLLGADTRLVSGSTFEKLCYAKTWILSVGFTLAFGSMFSKTWRVHSIFTNIRRDKKAIKDTQLFLIVAAILLLDIIVLGSWALISPFRFSIFELHAFRHKNVLIVPELERCVSDFSVVFQVIFYVFKGMLMIFGCFLAWETRAVNVPALNDSKYIGMCVYLVVVMCIVGLSLAFVLQERINEAFVLISFFIVCCTTLTLLLVFMPKVCIFCGIFVILVIELIRARGTDQQKRYNHKRLMKSMVGSAGGTFRRSFGASAGGVDSDRLSRELSLRSSEGADIKEKICAMEEDNLRLHEILIAKSTELWDLLERLRVLGESVRGPNGGAAICVGAQITGRVISMENIVEESPMEEHPLGSQHINIYRTVSDRAQRYDQEKRLNSAERRNSDEDDAAEDEEEEVLLVEDSYEVSQECDQTAKRILSLKRARTRADSDCTTDTTRKSKNPRRKESSVPSGLCGLLLPTTGEMTKSGTMLAMTLIAATDANFKRDSTRLTEDSEVCNRVDDVSAAVNTSTPARRSSTLFDITRRLRRSTTTFEYSKMASALRQRRDTSIAVSRSADVREGLLEPPLAQRLTTLSTSTGLQSLAHSSASEVYYEAMSNFQPTDDSDAGIWHDELTTPNDDNDEDSTAQAIRRHREAARSAHNAYHLLENSYSASSSAQSILAARQDEVGTSREDTAFVVDSAPVVDEPIASTVNGAGSAWVPKALNGNARRRTRKNKFPISASFT